jgi:hypothetical protein
MSTIHDLEIAAARARLTWRENPTDKTQRAVEAAERKLSAARALQRATEEVQPEPTPYDGTLPTVEEIASAREWLKARGYATTDHPDQLARAILAKRGIDELEGAYLVREFSHHVEQLNNEARASA